MIFLIIKTITYKSWCSCFVARSSNRILEIEIILRPDAFAVVGATVARSLANFEWNISTGEHDQNMIKQAL